MKKTKLVTEKIQVERITDVICNKCGKSCKTGNYDDRLTKTGKLIHGDPTRNEFDGIIEHVIQGGYFSKKLGDSTSYRFSVCEDCTVKFFKSFKVPVEIKDDFTGQEFVSIRDYQKHVKETEKAMTQWEKELKEKSKKLERKS